MYVAFLPASVCPLLFCIIIREYYLIKMMHVVVDLLACLQCLNTYQSDISKCQFYVDILVACKSSNSGAEAKLRVHEV